MTQYLENSGLLHPYTFLPHLCNSSTGTLVPIEKETDRKKTGHNHIDVIFKTDIDAVCFYQIEFKPKSGDGLHCSPNHLLEDLPSFAKNVLWLKKINKLNL